MVGKDESKEKQKAHDSAAGLPGNQDSVTGEFHGKVRHQEDNNNTNKNISSKTAPQEENYPEKVAAGRPSSPISASWDPGFSSPRDVL